LRGITVGLDVSDKFTSLCVLDRSGDVVEESRLKTTAAALSQRFSSMSPCLLVLELGTHSPWISRLLSSLGHEVIVANPRRVRLIADSTRKNDRSDAETLARLGRSILSSLVGSLTAPSEPKRTLSVSIGIENIGFNGLQCRGTD
jgi:transposase